MIKTLHFYLLFLLIPVSSTVFSQRIMENLGRGLVAVKTDSGTFLSWRYLGTEYASGKDISFNVYKGKTKLNDSPLTKATCFFDKTSEVGKYNIRVVNGRLTNLNPVINEYTIHTVVNGKEQTAGAKAVSMPAGYLSIPLKSGNYITHFAWPGDLDGNGEYDLVCLRKSKENAPSVVEAYSLEGKFLWRIDMGPNSIQQIPGVGKNDAPPASVGEFSLGGYRCRDGVTVYDLNGDGKAEVFIRTAPGVIFADGKVLEGSDPAKQYVSVIDGMTGKEIARSSMPEDYAQDGPLSGQFGIGYLDGVHPSLITKMINRAANKKFNIMICAWDFDGKNVSLRWKYLKKDPGAEFHQIRILDVNNDGRDDICDGSYVVNSDGKFLYAIPQGVHGDRFQITDIDPSRPGLEGFAIQQTEMGQVEYFPWVYYDAKDGSIIKNGSPVMDIARGTVADIDPTHPGCEMFCSDNGLMDAKANKIADQMPVPNFRIWWDGDLLSEILDKTSVLKWDYRNNSAKSIFNSAEGRFTSRNAVPFYGDILGDWREEIVIEKSDCSELMIFTTNVPTNHRIYSPAQNPAYRSCMTVKGYMQSTLVDYFLGEGMAEPPKPAIKLNW